MLLQHTALGLRRPPWMRTGAGHNYTGLQQTLPGDSGTRHRERFPQIGAEFDCRCAEMGWKTEKARLPGVTYGFASPEEQLVSCQGEVAGFPALDELPADLLLL